MDLVNVGKLLHKPLDSLLSSVVSPIRQVVENKILEYETEEFKRNFYVKTLIHRTYPRRLDEIYIPVSIREGAKGKKYIIKKVEDFFKNFPNTIVLIGSAGSGKSTLVKYILTESVRQGYRIPIKIEFRHLNKVNHDLNLYIRDDVFKFYKIGIEDKSIDSLLASGKFIFLFDGFDETIKEKRQSHIDTLERFIRKYNKNKYVITSRPMDEMESLSLSRVFYLSPLSNSQIFKFINKQLGEDEAIAKENIISTIKKSKNEKFKDFLVNPLLLTMYILTYQFYADLPERKSVFYSQVFDALYSWHDNLKSSFKRQRESSLLKHDFEKLLSIFSYVSYVENKIVFNKEYFNSILYSDKFEYEGVLESDLVLNDLSVGIGILVKDGFAFEYSHRAFQEYFTARKVSEMTSASKTLFYTKMLDILCDRNDFSHWHLLEILSEVDEVSFQSDFEIPLYSRIIEEYNEIDHFKASYGMGLLLKHEFLTESIMSSSLKRLAFKLKRNAINLNKLEEQVEEKKDDFMTVNYSSKGNDYKIRLEKELESMNKQLLIHKDGFTSTLSELIDKLNKKRDMIEENLIKQNSINSDLVDLI